ncbi:hypothetical protein SAMN05660816_04361 [Niastella yeongjuensis]|nr:hypothetical protein SAMN05660816_04361 [Niastella yeongjuensis]
MVDWLFNIKTGYPHLHNRLRIGMAIQPVKLPDGLNILKWFEVMLVV